MVLSSPPPFLFALAELPPLPAARPIARAALLVGRHRMGSPRNLCATIAICGWMRRSTRALVQHAGLAQALRVDVPIVVFPGDAATPDAMFPNNVSATVPRN